MFDGTRAHFLIWTVDSHLSRSAGEAALAKPRPLPAYIALSALAFCLVMPRALNGQDEKPAEASATTQPAKQTSPKPGSKDSDQESDPLKILWLRNPATGELVPVPGLTIDEYDKLDRIRRGLPPEITAPPNYVLNDLKLTGIGKGGSITFELDLEVELRDDRWARIPLGLSRAVFRSAPSEENWLVTPEVATEGFVLWARGKAGEKKNLKLQFEYPLKTTSELTRLQLSLPRARSSAMEISIEGVESVFRLEGSGSLDSSKFANGVTDIRCSGFTGALDLSWRPKTQPTATASWLEAFGAIELRVDGRRQIRADARLRIRLFGALNQPLRIQLPSGMRLSPDAGIISPFVRSQATVAGANPASQILELSIDPEAPSDLELRIQAESAEAIAANASELKLNGFEVLAAKRQWGNIDLLLTSDWYASAEQSQEVRRIDVDPGVVADPAFSRSRFEYATPGFVIAVAARLPRTLVEPSYDVFIESGQLRLEGQFKYRFRGPSAGAVEIDLVDWDLERVVSPDAAFLVDDFRQSGSRVVIPLSPQPLPAGAEAILRIEARKTGEANSAKVHLPLPKANTESPAIVRIQSDVNLEVTPRSADFKGVSIDSTGTTASSSGQKGQFVYRTRPGQEAPFLAFDVQVRKQSLVQGLVTQLTASSENVIGVQHEVQLNVAYEPLREITLDLPVTLAGLESMRVMLDDQPLERLDAAEQELVAPSSQVWTRCRFRLPQAMLGPLKFVVQYGYSVPETLEAGARRHLALPKLVTTSPLTSKPHQLVVRDPGNILQVDLTEWSRDLFEDASRPIIAGILYKSLKPQVELVFDVSEIIQDQTQSNRCDRYWLQTTVNRSIRNDRFCLRMSSWSSPLKIGLPQGVSTSSVLAAVNGVQVNFEPIDDRQVTLSSPRDGAGKPHVIELWYQCEEEPLQFGRAELKAPEVFEAIPKDRRYWQLVLPDDWYSLLRPAGWTQEGTFNIGDFWKGPDLGPEQTRLEKWVGASEQPPAPGTSNFYLFSSVTDSNVLPLVLAPRREVWLAVFGAAFLLAMLLTQFAAMRKPIVLSGLIAVAALVIILQPQWSGAALQLFIGAVFLALAIWFLRSILNPPRGIQVRSSPSRSNARSLDTALHSAESVITGRRGSSISSAPAPAGPAP